MNAGDQEDQPGEHSKPDVPVSDTLNLNLTFCTDEELIAEMDRRFYPLLMVYYKDDMMIEANLEESRKPRWPNGNTYICRHQRGLNATLIGMCDIIKHDLLHEE